jgi:hypothetical protein
MSQTITPRDAYHIIHTAILSSCAFPARHRFRHADAVYSVIFRRVDRNSSARLPTTSHDSPMRMDVCFERSIFIILVDPSFVDPCLMCCAVLCCGY